MANLETTLGRLDGQGTPKTAAEVPVPATGGSKGALEAAVIKTAQAVAPVAAPAQEADPARELMKIAEGLVGAEKQAEQEEMRMLGGAFADGAITKFAMFETEMRQQALSDAEKTAGAPQQLQGIHPDLLVKIAAEIGYQDTQGRIVLAAEEEKKDKEEKDDKKKDLPPFMKKKEDSSKEEDKKKPCDSEKEAKFDDGWNEAMGQVKSAAELEFYKGAAVAEAVVNSARQNQL